MSVLGTVIDTVGALVIVFGGIALIQEAHASLTWTRTLGRIVAWVPALSRDGERVLGQKARLTYEVGGAAVEGECRQASDDVLVKALPAGASTPIRYERSNPEAPEIVGSWQSRLSYPLGALAVGAAVLLGSTLLFG